MSEDLQKIIKNEDLNGLSQVKIPGDPVEGDPSKIKLGLSVSTFISNHPDILNPPYALNVNLTFFNNENNFSGYTNIGYGSFNHLTTEKLGIGVNYSNPEKGFEASLGLNLKSGEENFSSYSNNPSYPLFTDTYNQNDFIGNLSPGFDISAEKNITEKLSVHAKAEISLPPFTDRGHYGSTLLGADFDKTHYIEKLPSSGEGGMSYNILKNLGLSLDLGFSGPVKTLTEGKGIEHNNLLPGSVYGKIGIKWDIRGR